MSRKKTIWFEVAEDEDVGACLARMALLDTVQLEEKKNRYLQK